ncbi:MAG TPA: hypothetical protein VEI03_14160 [Stellaceae bacterium]|nr:hypothetical protein [Stellaceae bacterium]
MPAPFTLRTPLGGFEREPRGYDDLRRLALRYAKDELAGRTLCNHATQLAITLSPAALAAATRPGAPSALLWAIPDLPALLSHALYVRTVADPRRRPDIRRVHLLAARAEIAGRPVELLFAVRETFGGQCFLDRVSERGASTRGRQDGGETPDDTSGAVSDSPDSRLVADAGAADSTTSDAPEPKATPVNAGIQTAQGRLIEPQFDKVDSFLLTPGGDGATGQFHQTLHYDLDAGRYYPGVVISNEDDNFWGNLDRALHGMSRSNPVHVELQMTVQTPDGTQQGGRHRAHTPAVSTAHPGRPCCQRLRLSSAGRDWPIARTGTCRNQGDQPRTF